MTDARDRARAPGWLLLIHQLPPRPSYFRVKIWRRLQRLGAVAIKNSVYALPATEEAREDLSWVLREIVDGGGDASTVEARLVEGLTDEQVREMFRAARDPEYRAVADEARTIARKLKGKRRAAGGERASLEAQAARLQKRISEIAAIDFFHGRGRETAEGLVRDLLRRLAPPPEPARPRAEERTAKPRGGTWVTRTGIHVDRMASAWLIRRFIDPDASFRFVSPREYRHRKGELRFDMFDGEYTHLGERCTFEVLLDLFEVGDAALRPIAEIVHDIDLKDGKYGRPETAGVERLVNGIALAHRDDEVRLARASAVFDELYESWAGRRSSRGTPERPGR